MQERREKEEDMRNTILTQFLTQEARARCMLVTTSVVVVVVILILSVPSSGQHRGNQARTGQDAREHSHRQHPARCHPQQAERG